MNRMEASPVSEPKSPFTQSRLLAGTGLLVLFITAAGAKHVTPNFEVEAPTASIAEKVALTAERCREDLAVEWLGRKMPNWSARCKVRVKVGQVGAGGSTTFSFGGGHVYGWDMTVQGPLERILDSVIPHEVSHTILACHFRRPLPRWADEGAATLAEEAAEQRRQQKLAEEVLPTKRRIPLRDLLQITEYPKNMQNVLTLYAEGFSLVNYLVQKQGKAQFLTCLQDAHERGWDEALRRNYGDANVESLEQNWNNWVIAGSPTLRSTGGDLFAQADIPTRDLRAGVARGLEKIARAETERNSSTVADAASIVRSQSPDGSKNRTKTALPLRVSGHTSLFESDSIKAPPPIRPATASREPRPIIFSDTEPPASEPRHAKPARLTLPLLRRLSHEN